MNLKKVLRVKFNQLDTVRNSKDWWEEYGTVYYDHIDERRDEFCVKDPAQIFRWISVVNDTRIQEYALNEEFEKPLCGCI